MSKVLHNEKLKKKKKKKSRVRQAHGKEGCRDTGWSLSFLSRYLIGALTLAWALPVSQWRGSVSCTSLNKDVWKPEHSKGWEMKPGSVDKPRLLSTNVSDCIAMASREKGDGVWVTHPDACVWTPTKGKRIFT